MLDEFFKHAANAEYDALDPTTEHEIEQLFSTTTRGLREIVLVIAIGRLLYPAYNAYTAFYDCEPRALYEQAIRAALQKHNIPRGKSGPLNVAKATKGIDESWAAQRRPRDVAQVVVELTKKLDSYTEQQLSNFVIVLIARFLQEAERIGDLAVSIDIENNPAYIFKLCQSLIKDVPDRGNTPQVIVGYLLEAYHEDLQTNIMVSGHEEGASVTNTTSKKPGDIVEAQPDGTIVCIYEVTVKKFDNNRIRDSYESMRSYVGDSDDKTLEVIVICRIEDHPENVEQGQVSHSYLGELQYETITYHFIDIYEWVMTQLVRMPPSARLAFTEKLQQYIAETNTAEQVKQYWKQYKESSDTSGSTRDAATV